MQPIILLGLLGLLAITGAQANCPPCYTDPSGYCGISVFEYYYQQGYPQNYCYPVSYSTSTGSISWNNLSGGSLVINQIGFSFTVTFNVILGQNQYQQCSVTCGGGGSGKGDPHFQGFDQSRFDFNGFAGETYEMLSTQDTLLNVEMVPRGFVTTSEGERFQLPQFEGVATWIGGLGFTHGPNQIAVFKTEDEKAGVTINGDALELGSTATASDLVVIYEEEDIAGRDDWFWPGTLRTPSVFMATPDFVIKVIMLPNFSRRLDVSVAPRFTAETAPKAEGILGRTMTNFETNTVLNDNLTDIVWLEDTFGKIPHSKTLEDRLKAAYQTTGLFSHDAAATAFDASTITSPKMADKALKIMPVITSTASSEEMEAAVMTHQEKVAEAAIDVPLEGIKTSTTVSRRMQL